MNYPITDRYPSQAKCWKRSYNYDRVAAHLECNYPPMQNQWGFLPGKLTTSAILSATQEWFTLLEEGKEVGAVFFDLTKAFDSVSHRQLIAKLETTGLSPYLLNWIKSYLTDRKQIDRGAKWGGVSSQPLPVLSGVPHGSILGPLLFLVYINDICDAGTSNGSKLIVFADDIELSILRTTILHYVDIYLGCYSNSIQQNARLCYFLAEGQKECAWPTLSKWNTY